MAFVNVFVFSQTDTSQSSSVESSVLDESQILLGETNPESQITFSDD